MELRKIGKFIANERKAHDITQEKLAEMLDVSDRAVSKWERGICMPSTAAMPGLCKILDISINELFCGERIDMKEEKKILEQNLLAMAEAKEEKDKALLRLEWAIGFICTGTLFALIISCAFVESEAMKFVLLMIGMAQFLIGMFFALKIEQTAGYYKCAECGHKYVPSFGAVLLAPHMGRTRKMKCPKCSKRSWQKKVVK